MPIYPHLPISIHAPIGVGYERLMNRAQVEALNPYLLAFSYMRFICALYARPRRSTFFEIFQKIRFSQIGVRFSQIGIRFSQIQSDSWGTKKQKIKEASGTLEF